MQLAHVITHAPRSYHSRLNVTYACHIRVPLMQALHAIDTAHSCLAENPACPHTYHSLCMPLMHLLLAQATYACNSRMRIMHAQHSCMSLIHACELRIHHVTSACMLACVPANPHASKHACRHACHSYIRFIHHTLTPTCKTYGIHACMQLALDTCSCIHSNLPPVHYTYL